MNVTVVATLGSEPLTVEQAKTYARVDFTNDDMDIAALIAAARDYCERYTGRSFVQKRIRLTLGGFCEYLELPYPPVVEVESIKYLDVYGVEQTLSANAYVADTDAHPGRVYPAYGYEWPSTREVSNAVTVTYTVGGTAPEMIVQAIKLMLNHWYTNRTPVVTQAGVQPYDVPMTANSILRLHRILNV